jgi:hypothetical protein
MTKEELDLLFEYDYNSGKLIWKHTGPSELDWI